MCTSLRLEWRNKEDEVLRSGIGQRLRSGKLPRAPASSAVRSRAGNGGICDACAEPIANGQIHYEAVFCSADEPTADRVIVLHLACYELWCQESTS